MRVLTITALIVASSYGGTIFQLEQYGNTQLGNSLVIWTEGTMTSQAVDMVGHVVGGAEAGSYSEVRLHADLSGLPDLSDVVAGVWGLDPQSQVYADNHAQTIMFNFTEIVGDQNGLRLGLYDRMGMIYVWQGRIMVNFWIYLASADVPGPNSLLPTGDLIAYADPVEAPEAGSGLLLLAGLGVALMNQRSATVKLKRTTPGCAKFFFGLNSAR